MTKPSCACSMLLKLNAEGPPTWRPLVFWLVFHQRMIAQNECGVSLS
jgi:hypothetical protein